MTPYSTKVASDHARLVDLLPGLQPINSWNASTVSLKQPDKHIKAWCPCAKVTSLKVVHSLGNENLN